MKTWARMLLLALALSSCEPYPPGYYNGYPGSGYSGPPSYYGSGYYSSPPSYYPEPNGYPGSGGYYNAPPSSYYPEPNSYPGSGGQY